MAFTRTEFSRGWAHCWLATAAVALGVLDLGYFGLGYFGLAASAVGAEATADQLRFFEEKVRPVLTTKCQRCHGDAKQKGGLRLDSLAAAIAGGESGAAIQPGEPDASLLIEAINYESIEMPPEGKLPEEEIAVLTAWVRMGAPWPANTKTSGGVRAKSGGISDEDRAYWAFQPVRPVAEPTVNDRGWSRNAVDGFVYERLALAGLQPSPPADPGALVRRLHFDLVGLPPAPEVVQSFAADPSPQAYAALVDRLLDSPAYGEKWARHWLDLVRYAESDGFKQDAYRPNSWRYRDYVIRALNNDKPYDRFIREQIAGDEMPDVGLDELSATSYLRHWIYEYNQRDVRTQWSNILNDVTDVTAEVFLGLSVGCARCHDHKFDPILQKDYFRLQAFFAPMLPRDDVPFLAGADRQEYQRKQADWEERSRTSQEELARLEQPVRARIADAAINKFPPDIRPMLRKPAAERTPFEHQLADLANRQVHEELVKLDVGAKLKGAEKERWQILKEQLAELDQRKQTAPEMALTVTDVGPLAPVSIIPSDRSKTPVPPGFLSVLDPSDVEILQPPTSTTTGRRTALANWITRPDHPLTSRVIVNRIWQYHFGKGLVGTTSDFGRLGDAPSHPELLDWLARWFVDGGWRFKPLHRLLVTSATYQQSALRGDGQTLVALRDVRAGDATAAATSGAAAPTVDPLIVDPDNRWLWHMPVRRLDAEQIRDAALAASGELQDQLGGPSVEGDQPRRTIYTKVLRNERDALLDVFDAPDGFNSTSFRNVTTTPTQALLMINGPWLIQRAHALARRLNQESPDNPVKQLEQAFWLVYGRRPTRDEQEAGLAFLARDKSSTNPVALAAAVPGFAPFPGREGLALDVQPSATQPLVLAPNGPSLPSGDFTVQATVLLRSLYDDASVRTIAAQWDGDNRHPGWSLGVTSKKSRFEPRNLILQLVGSTKEAAGVYEVVASNLRLELNRPYDVSVHVRIADPGEAGVVFCLRDLSIPDAPLKTARLPHKVIKEYRGNADLVIGGRAGQSGHRWDGLIDEVRISNQAPRDEETAREAAADDPNLVAYWRFETADGLLHDSSPRNNHLTSQLTSTNRPPVADSALVDFCHVLLNSNEFLYVD